MLEAYDNLIASGLEAMIDDNRIKPCDTRALARALNLLGVNYMLDSFGREPTADPETAVTTLELIWLRVIDPNTRQSDTDAPPQRSRPGSAP